MPEKHEESWTTEIDSKYRLVILAAKRSKQLQKGARPRVHSALSKPTKIALEEVQQGLVRYEPMVRKPESEE